MKILFVTQIIPYPPHGGVLQRGYNLLRELGKEHEVHLLAFHHPDEIPYGAPLEESRKELGKFCVGVDYFYLWPKRSTFHKLFAFAAGVIYPKPFSVLAQRNAALAKRIDELCRTWRPDVVHLDTIALVPFKKYCGAIPCVLGHHNIESQLMLRRAERETNSAARAYVHLQGTRLVKYERAHAGAFKLNITVSEADADTLKQICPEAATAVVPNGVDTEYFTPRHGEETPTLIYTGGMNMFANRDAVDWFIDTIWPLVKAAIPAARFVAIGRAPSAKVLQAMAQDSAIEAPGFVDDVRPWIARSAVYVVPLRVGGGTRLKMVDAMAQGKAIVATTLGAEGIHGVDGEHFRLADDPKRFAQTVIELLNNPTERQRLGAAARARALSHYSWPMLGKQQSAAYQQAIASSVK